MAAAAGVEPATCSLGESRSIQLSYATSFCISGRTNMDTVFSSMEQTGQSGISDDQSSKTTMIGC